MTLQEIMMSEFRQVEFVIYDEEQNVLIANSEGKFVEDTRVRSRLAIQATASDGVEMQTGFYGPGAHQVLNLLKT